MQEVLSRPEYQEAGPSLVARARSWLAEQLGRLLENMAGTEYASLVGSLVLVALVVAAVVLAVRFARGVRRDPGVASPTLDAVGRSSTEWAAEADEHERAGRRREALRCRYRSLVAALAAAGAVDEAPGRTAGEYLAELRARRPAAADDVTAVTIAFEASWYGNLPVTDATLDEVRAHVESARSAARRRPAAAGTAPGAQAARR